MDGRNNGWIREGRRKGEKPRISQAVVYCKSFLFDSMKTEFSNARRVGNRRNLHPSSTTKIPLIPAPSCLKVCAVLCTRR